MVTVLTCRLNSTNSIQVAGLPSKSFGAFGGLEGTRLDAQTERWRRKLSYYPYYGRGYVQLTHLAGYARYTRAAVDLIYDPDLVMQGDIALGMLINGMKMGAFGHRLDQHLNETKTDFVKARQVVNAMDHAQEVANLAQGWLNKLSTAVYP